MRLNRLANFIGFKHLKIERMYQWPHGQNNFECKVLTKGAFCTRCGVYSESIYDHRVVQLKDAPVRAQGGLLKMRKRRLSCKEGRKPFTERLPGVLPRKRYTERDGQSLLWACETFSDLKSVTKHYRCSFGFVYLTLYRHLDLKLRRNQYPWPKTIGIDEHSFQKRRAGSIPYATLIVDDVNKKKYKLLPTKIADEMVESLGDQPTTKAHHRRSENSENEKAAPQQCEPSPLLRQSGDPRLPQ